MEGEQIMEFKPWPKIPRIENKKEFYTEKIDGTNACIIVIPINSDESPTNPIVSLVTDYGYVGIWAQSRSRLITPKDDNYGFARWVEANAQELSKLGEGYHYGEWWGLGIQRGYNQTEKRFSLFNTKQWGPHNPNTPTCVSVVPTINVNSVEEAKTILIQNGSLAAPGFMNVEGVIVFEYNTKSYWKAIINK